MENKNVHKIHLKYIHFFVIIYSKNGGKKEVEKSMLEDGMDLEKVSKLTGISIDEINQLKNNIIWYKFMKRYNKKKVKTFFFFDKKGHIKILKWYWVILWKTQLYQFLYV